MLTEVMGTEREREREPQGNGHVTVTVFTHGRSRCIRRLRLRSSSSCTVVSLLSLRSPSARAHPPMYVARNVTIAVSHHGTIAVSHHGVVACVARPCMSSALPLCAVRRLCVHSHAGCQPWSRRCNAVQEPAACSGKTTGVPNGLSLPLSTCMSTCL